MRLQARPAVRRAGLSHRQRGLLHRRERDSAGEHGPAARARRADARRAAAASGHATHFSLEEAIEVARELAPRQTYFTHMSHELEHDATNAALPAGMALAYDGQRIPLRDR